MLLDGMPRGGQYRDMSISLGIRACAAVGLVIGLTACGDGGIVTVPADHLNGRIVALPGDEVRITLGNVGPMEYLSPPDVSSAAISFVGVEVIPPFDPGGPTQQFRFAANRSGEAIVTFHQMLGDDEVRRVVDTVDVR
jgi:hypothetical protein